jgi:ribosome modulation factor
MQAIAEGAHARVIGRPKDSCPYPAGSPEQRAWLEGYDGTPTEDAFDSPIADA